MNLSQRVSRLSGSATLALAAKAKEMAAAGRDVVNMAVGEPDFDAPILARQAAHAAIDSGKVKYTPAAGLMSLRQAIAGRLREERGVTTSAEEVVVCHSAKHALSHALLALVDPGDDVLLPTPAWGSYDEQVRSAGGRPVQVPPRPDGSCAPDLDAIAAAVGPKTRGIMLNTPSNPSGYVWTVEEIAALCGNEARPRGRIGEEDADHCARQDEREGDAPPPRRTRLLRRLWLLIWMRFLIWMRLTDRMRLLVRVQLRCLLEWPAPSNGTNRRVLDCGWRR